MKRRLLPLALLAAAFAAPAFAQAPIAGPIGNASGVTVNTTAISGGTTTRLLFDNAGTVGETSGVTWLPSGLTVVPSPATGFSAGALNINGNAAALPANVHASGLHIAAIDADHPGILLDGWGANSWSTFVCRDSGGTGATPTATPTATELCRFSGRGYGTTGYTASNAGFSIFSGQAFTDAVQGSYFVVRTVPLGTAGDSSATGAPFSTVFEPGGGVCIGTRAQCEIASGGSDLASGVLVAKTSATVGGGSAITSSGPGGALGAAAFIGTPISGANGGTGVANTGITETFAANFTTTGAGAPTLAFPASSATYTFPTTTATLARTDAGQAFTGVQTISNGATLPTPAANTVLQMAGTTSGATTLEVDSFTSQVNFFARRANTSSTAPSALTSGNIINNFVFQGYNGTAYATGARIQSITTATTWDGTHNGAFLDFGTSPDSGGAVANDMRLQGSGGLSVGNANIATDGGAGVVVASGYQVGATAGITHTCTITATQTLIFTNGLLTGGTC
jgi:hypothetical protein